MAGEPVFVMLGEAVLLGAASGPVCVAACGPVLVPALLTQTGGFRAARHYLSVFLAARLAGYLLFAAIAWQVGALVALPPKARILLTAVVYVLLAAILLGYALKTHSTRAHACAAGRLVQIGERRRSTANPAALGLLTGLNLCPPFIAAGVRAAQSASMAQALVFFALFFVGTSVWFVPFSAMGCIRRNEAVMTVAYITMAFVGLYYLVLGISLFAGGRMYGY